MEYLFFHNTIWIVLSTLSIFRLYYASKINNLSMTFEAIFIITISLINLS
jgi:hypothetical protein